MEEYHPLSDKDHAWDLLSTDGNDPVNYLNADDFVKKILPLKPKDVMYYFYSDRTINNTPVKQSLSKLLVLTDTVTNIKQIDNRIKQFIKVANKAFQDENENTIFLDHLDGITDQLKNLVVKFKAGNQNLDDDIKNLNTKISDAHTSKPQTSGQQALGKAIDIGMTITLFSIAATIGAIANFMPIPIPLRIVLTVVSGLIGATAFIMFRRMLLTKRGPLFKPKPKHSALRGAEKVTDAVDRANKAQLKADKRAAIEVL